MLDSTVFVSSNYRIEIPKWIREELQIEAGQQLRIILYESRIELIPVNSPPEMRGFLEGIETTVEREKCRL